jgi:hypothetical protein
MKFPQSRPLPARTVARGIGGGAAALAALALLAGCGGDGGGSSSTPASASSGPALSHADLVKQANAACTKAETQIAKLTPARSLSALADYAAKVQDVGASLHDQLSALNPAAADRAAFTKYVAGVDASNTALGEMASAAGDSDATGVRAAAKSIDDAAVGVLATRAGLSGCAATPGTAGSAS